MIKDVIMREIGEEGGHARREIFWGSGDKPKRER